MEKQEDNEVGMEKQYFIGFKFFVGFLFLFSFVVGDQLPSRNLVGQNENSN